MKDARPAVPGERTVTLYRAVGPDEARAIERAGGFAIAATSGYVDGKWFATSLDDAVRWGLALQRLARSGPFRVASVEVPAILLDEFEWRARLDRIGPACYVRHDQLPRLNEMGVIAVLEATYGVETRP